MKEIYSRTTCLGEISILIFRIIYFKIALETEITRAATSFLKYYSFF